MVNVAPEWDSKQSDEHRTSRELPYDPKEWEQRVALARAQREKILKQRAVDARRSEYGSGAGSSRAIPTKATAPSQNIKSLPGALPGKGNGAVRSGRPLRAVPAGPSVTGAPLHAKGRLRPLLVGLLLGSVAGGTAVMLVGTGLPELRLPAFPVTQQSPTVSPAAQPDAIVQRPPMSTPERGRIPVSIPASEPAGAVVALPEVAAGTEARDMEPEIWPDAPMLAELPAGVASRQDPALSPADTGILLSGMEPGPELTEGWALSASQANLFSAPAMLPDAIPQNGLNAPQAPVSRIAIHIPQQMGAERRGLIMARLADMEWPTQIIETPFTISETHVRYFHSQDQGSAEALAELLESTARDFTHFQPSPEDGYLELWMNGQGAPAPAPVRSAPTPVATPALPAPPASVSPTVPAPVSRATAPRGTREGRGLEILFPRLGVNPGPAARTGISRPESTGEGRVSSPETGSSRGNAGSGASGTNPGSPSTGGTADGNAGGGASAGPNGGSSGGGGAPGNSAGGSVGGGSNAAEGNASGGGGASGGGSTGGGNAGGNSGGNGGGNSGGNGGGNSGGNGGGNSGGNGGGNSGGNGGGNSGGNGGGNSGGNGGGNSGGNGGGNSGGNGGGNGRQG